MALVVLLNVLLLSSVGFSGAVRSNIDQSLLTEFDEGDESVKDAVAQSDTDAKANQSLLAEIDEGHESVKDAGAHAETRTEAKANQSVLAEIDEGDESVKHADVGSDTHTDAKASPDYCEKMAPTLKGASDCWKHCSYKAIYCDIKASRHMVDDDCAIQTCSPSLFGSSVGDKYCKELAPHLLGAAKCWRWDYYKKGYCESKAEQRKVDKDCASQTTWKIGKNYCKELAPHLLGAGDGCWQYDSYKERYCGTKAEKHMVDNDCAKTTARSVGKDYCNELAPHLLGASGCWRHSSYKKIYCDTKAEKGIFDRDC